MNELEKRLWWRRGAEYKLKKRINDEEAKFIHAPLIGNPKPHTFTANIEDVMETSLQCTKCDETIDGFNKLEEFLKKKKVKYQKGKLVGTPILIATKKGRKIGIVYFDKSYYRNVVNENEKAFKVRRAFLKNKIIPLIFTHLKYETLIKNLLEGLKEI